MTVIEVLNKFISYGTIITVKSLRTGVNYDRFLWDGDTALIIGVMNRVVREIMADSRRIAADGRRIILLVD